MNKNLMIFFAPIIMLLSSCSTKMDINVTVPNRPAFVGENILILYVPGLTQAEFLQLSPKAMGSFILKDTSHYTLAHVNHYGAKYTMRVPYSNSTSSSVFILGDIVTEESPDTWKFYFPQDYDDAVDINISKSGDIRLKK
ncbi:hypothetical protein OAO18_06385 [Francisellaceae bacterium]|nr:hypothetical protein [Francisellaceae bacterium]